MKTIVNKNLNDIEEKKFKSIALENVDFSYPNSNKLILKDINLDDDVLDIGKAMRDKHKKIVSDPEKNNNLFDVPFINRILHV